jgi:hypothetical protein
LIFKYLSSIDALSYASDIALKSLSSSDQDSLDFSLVSQRLADLLFHSLSISFPHPLFIGSLLVACKLGVNCWAGSTSSSSSSLVGVGGSRWQCNEALGVPVGGACGVGSSSLLESPFGFPDVFLALVGGLVSFPLDVEPFSVVEPGGPLSGEGLLGGLLLSVVVVEPVLLA